MASMKMLSQINEGSHEDGAKVSPEDGGLQSEARMRTTWMGGAKCDARVAHRGDADAGTSTDISELKLRILLIAMREYGADAGCLWWQNRLRY